MHRNHITILLIVFVSNALALNRSFDMSDSYSPKIHNVFAGYLNATKNSTARIFYQLFSTAKKSINNTDPLIVWFQGGPGGSSLAGAFLELGPYKIENKTNLTYNKYNWAIKQNLMLVDQPIGVGLSPNGDIKWPNTTEAAAVQILNFFNQFFEIYPNLKSNDFILAGESYAGHYLPAFGKILIDNGYKIAGISIGDGWTFPQKQFGLSDYLLAGGIISNSRFDNYQDNENKARTLGLQGKFVDAANIFDYEAGEIGNSQDVNNVTGADMLNYRIYGAPFDAQAVQDYMNSEKVKEIYQIPKDLTYVLENPEMYASFTWDIYQSFAPQIEELLTKTRILLYSGQNDIEVNTASAYKWISEMNWSGMEDFAAFKKQEILSNSKLIGFYKKHSNLTFAQINNAGHMVPADQPASASYLIENWLSDSL